MAKIKNRKRISVDKVHKKINEKNTKKTLNPFEIHINKEKMRVLGKKLKNDKGLPGVSRAKAIQKRKHTLLNEYKTQHKTNKFMDRRIGEKGQVSEDQKIMSRFAAIRAKAHNRKSIFNLADDEVLTHRGQTLSEIEKFEDPRSDDEDSEDEHHKTGKLESNFVRDAHFGGGVLSNTGQEGAKTHKQLIDQLIDESKKRKAEKQKIKEATLELTEKLDTEWKDLVQLVSKNNKKEQAEEKPKVDDYDKMMRELKFEARGTVSDRLKTEDEIAREEKEKLEKLENERLQRMKGFMENNPVKPKHRSADDLDDDFVYESEEEENMLTYDDQGQSNVQVVAEINGKSLGKGDDDVEDKETTNSNLDLDSDEEDAEDNEEESEGDDSDSDDSLADLKEDDGSDSESESVIQTQSTEKLVGKKRKLETPDESDQEKRKSKKNEPYSQSEREELEKAGNDLPFTYKLPESYESFLEIFENSDSLAHKKIILERMVKCNHPSLSQGNKTGLGLLFAYFLQYINDQFSDLDSPEKLKEHFHTLSALMPQIFELAQLNKENTHSSIMEVIKEKQQVYRKTKKQFPGLEVLVFLKLASLLFPTSDFRHQVVTPCLIFMEQILTNCRVKSAKDVAYGLFVCTLVLEYTSLSHRYLPAAINFLAGIVHMAIPKTSIKIIKVRPPFKPLSSELVLTKKITYNTLNSKFNICNLLENSFTDLFKASAFLVTVILLKDFKDNLKELPSVVEIFEEVESYLGQIPVDLYPADVQSECQELCDSFKETRSARKLFHLVLEAKKPKALRLYEPKIVPVYDGKKKKVQSREKAERDKLLHKLKKETKGALREIRRDKSFLGRVKINQKIQSDKERREKVNRIYAEAANQQSELNALDRKKKRK